MVVTLLLPWFPILLGVGVGGRLLGRTRGLALGTVCALFWIVLAQASAGPAIWGDPWRVATIVTGALAIAAMGCWAGETATGRTEPDSAAPAPVRDMRESSSTEAVKGLHQVAIAIDLFDNWLEQHRDDTDPWPRFGEFIRVAMYRGVQAGHVKPFRLLSEGQELMPLREPDPLVETTRVSARRGILGHVVSTGRTYVKGDPAQGELIERMAADSPEPIVWCFAIRQGARRLGAITVGQLDLHPERHRPLLRTYERLVAQCWCTLAEAVKSRSAQNDDPVTGLITRPGFLLAAERSLRESYDQGEPVAVAVFAVEGLRELTDTGRWEVADQMVREIAGLLRRKVRMDDTLGRFDGSRFALLLRRVDSELASLIVTQIMARVSALCGDQARWRTAVTTRCGVVGSGTESPDLQTLIVRALAQTRRARIEGIPIAPDLVVCSS